MNVTLKKRKSVPKSKQGRKLKYPFNTMDVGHYFEMPVKTPTQKRKFYSVFSAARRYGYRHDIVFVSRIENEIGSIQREK